VGLQKTGLQHVIRKIFRHVIHHVHDLVQSLLRHGCQKKIESPLLRDDRLRPKLAFRENIPGRRPGHTERQQDDRLLLQFLGMAMSRQGPPLQQEDEDDGRNGDEDRKDGDVTGWRISKNSMLRVAKSRVTTVEVRKKSKQRYEKYFMFTQSKSSKNSRWYYFTFGA
jgi:hypothetical protein